MERLTKETRTKIYATSMRPLHGENSVSVPILVDGELIACSTMHYIMSVTPPRPAVEDYLGAIA